MKENVRTTLKQENEYRANIKKTLYTIATPIVAVVVLGIVFVLSTILSTMSAVSKYKTVSTEQGLGEIVESINLSSYTSPFMEGYKAKYNYATAIAPTNPVNALTIYAFEVIPYSPPEFVCYPIVNGVHYATVNGDNSMASGLYIDAEYFYNYAENFMVAAPFCFGGGGGSSSDSDSEQESDSAEEGNPQDGEGGEKGSGENESDYEQAMQDIKNKQNEARAAQGKETENPNESNRRPSEQQKRENQENTALGERQQRETENIRKAEKEAYENGEYSPPNPVDRPW